MGYYVNYSGDIICNALLPEDLYNKIVDWFDGEVGFKDNVLSISGYDKYYSDTVEEFLESIKPYCVSGWIEYEGEDGAHWRFVFKNGENKEWEEDEGHVFYDSELPKTWYNKEEFLGNIIDIINKELPVSEKMNKKISEKLKALMIEWNVFQ